MVDNCVLKPIGYRIENFLLRFKAVYEWILSKIQLTLSNLIIEKACHQPFHNYTFEWHTELFLVVFPCNNHSIFVAEIRAKTQLVTHDLTCMAAQTTRYDRWTKKEENRYWKPKKSWYYNSMTGFWGNDKSSMMHHKWVGYKILNTVKIIVFLSSWNRRKNCPHVLTNSLFLRFYRWPERCRDGLHE